MPPLPPGSLPVVTVTAAESGEEPPPESLARTVNRYVVDGVSPTAIADGNRGAGDDDHPVPA